MKKIESCPVCDGQTFDVRPYDPNPYAVETGWPEHHCFVDKNVAICKACGFGFTYEVMTDEDISAFYRAVYTAPEAKKTAPRPTDLYEFTPRFFTQVLYLKNFIQLYDGMRILELGPNEVSTLPAYNLFCKPDYCYFDQLEWPIIKSYGGRSLGNYASGDNIRREFSAGSLDLIHSSHSLEHINPISLNNLFDGFSAAIADGGHLFFEIPDDYAYEGLSPPHTLFFTEACIRTLLERHNFEIVSVGHRDGGGRLSDHSGERPKQHTAETTKKSMLGYVRSIIGRIILGNETLSRITKPWRLRRAFGQIVKQIPTPYEASPYYRVLARRRER